MSKDLPITPSTPKTGRGIVMRDGVSADFTKGYSKITGISFAIPEGWDRRAWACGWLSGQMGCYFVKMPCGRTYEFGGAADIPLETMPCECGNEKEFVVEWAEVG